MIEQKPPPSRRQKNTWKLTVLKLARNMLLITPVIALYFTSHGLSLTQITLLQSIFSIAYFSLEIPTGYISDRYGRKTSIIVGTIIGVIGYLFYWIGTDFWSFALAEIILALGRTCISGSDSALLYDTLKQAGKEKAAKKREGRINFAGDLAWVISWAIAWFIWFHYGFDILRLLTAGIVWVTIPIAFSLEEIHSADRANTVYNARKDITQIWKTLQTQPRILWLIIYTGVISYATYSLVWSQQQWLEQLWAPVAWFWVIRWIVRMSVAWAWLSAHRYDERLWHLRSLGWLLIGILIGFAIIASWLHRWVALVGLCIAYAMRWLQQPLTSYYLNQQISSSLRATTLSVMTMVHRMIYAAILPLQGRLGDYIWLQTMFIVMIVVFAFVGGLSWLQLRKVTRLDIAANT